MKLKMDFVSSATLDEKPKDKRIDFILNRVRDGSILIVDGVMTPDEEMDLIRETMRRVDMGFPGIEVCSLKKELKGFPSFFEKLSDQRMKIRKALTGSMPERTDLRTGITLIGPARYIKKIKKNPKSFSVMAEA